MTDDDRLARIEHGLRELRARVGGESALDPLPPTSAELYAIERDKRLGTGKPLLRPRDSDQPKGTKKGAPKRRSGEATDEQIADARRLLDADTLARQKSGRGGRPTPHTPHPEHPKPRAG